jgi:poly(3-hydroxybutyrate) depolymerase
MEGTVNNMYYLIARFWAEALQPMKPMDWTITNTIIYENNSLKLRRFNELSDTKKLPIFILAPNAGHHLNISEPLIKRCLQVDAERAVYVLDWQPPATNSSHKSDSLNHMIQNINICVNKLGNQVHLLTLCQGAWAGAIYAALYPDSVLSYTDGAGPIDFSAGAGKIKTFCEFIPQSFFENLVNIGCGVERGEFQLMGFKNLNPYERYYRDYLELWFAVCDGDEKAIQRWHRFKDWYDQPQNLAGVWYLEAVDKLFKNNLLVQGKLEILGRKVDLGQIKCPVFLIAGDKDDITPPPQVFNMEKYVSGKVEKHLVKDSGHIGVFVKESSLDYWEQSIIRKLDDLESLVLCKPSVS